MTDKTLGACQCRERHAPTYWKGVVREYKDALEKAESRPLTPDAITDEMVERAQHKIHLRATRIPAETIRLALVAALTEPPARPEGADLIDALLFDMGVDEKRDEVANYIAARLNVSPKEDR